MEWKKLGIVYQPKIDKNHPKLITHAANPLPVHIHDDMYRIYYSGRDKKNRSSVGAIDFDIRKKEIVKIFNDPVFIHGEENSFYSHGVSIGCKYRIKNMHYILFMGWHIPEGRHWRGEIGRLLIHSDGYLTYNDCAPVIGRDSKDPISLSYPCIYIDANDLYHMWYGSTKSWDAGNGEMLHVINYATSIEGELWSRKGLAIPYEIGESQAFSRPTVLKSKLDGLDMWFSYRSGDGTTYRIGYAHTDDMQNWELDNNKAGIDVATCGWDSEMICYPYVFDHCGERYMLYNGNGYGRTGFGLAVLDGR